MAAPATRRLESGVVALPALAVLLLVEWRLAQTVNPDHGGATWRTWLLLAIGALIGLGAWTWCVWRTPPRRDTLGALAPQPLDFLLWRWGLTAIAGGFALIAWRSLHGNQFSRVSVIAWPGATLIWLLAWWPWERAERAAPPSAAERRTRRITLVLLAAITLLGAWLRFYRLQEMPYDITQDHAWKLLDIKTILDGGRPLFLTNNTGREPWQFYYVATLIRLFNLPLQFISLKIANSIIGTLTIPLLYLFGREVGGRKLGLFAALLYAIGKWPISTTRMGLRFPYATLPAALVLIHLWRYARMGRRSDALLCGFWMGFGLYGYIGIRVVPLVIALVFVGLLLDQRRRGQRRTVIGHGLLTMVTVALVFLPLGHFMLERPDEFWYRAGTRATGSERSIDAVLCVDPASGAELDPLLCRAGIFLDNTWRGLAAFNWRGDRSEVNHVAYTPFFDVVSAALLLAALPLIAWRLFHERALRWRLLLLALPILLLATTLSLAFPQENPSTSRTGIVMPVVFVLAAAPLALLSEWLLNFQPLQQWAAVRRQRLAVGALVLAGLFGLALQQNFHSYFVELDAQYREFVPNTGEIAAAVLDRRDAGITLDNAWLLSWPYWLEGRSVSVHLGDITWHTTHTIEPDQPLPPRQPNQPMLFLFNLDDDKRHAELQGTFPDGIMSRAVTGRPDKSFFIFYVPPAP